MSPHHIKYVFFGFIGTLGNFDNYFSPIILAEYEPLSKTLLLKDSLVFWGTSFCQLLCWIMNPYKFFKDSLGLWQSSEKYLSSFILAEYDPSTNKKNFKDSLGLKFIYFRRL